MGPDFENRRVLVTGAASGIGEATCRRFAEFGASVVAVDRDRDKVAEVAASMPDAVAVVADVADPAQVDKAFATVGTLDVVVHSAGIDDPVAKEEIAAAIENATTPDLLTVLDDDRWRRMMAVNLDGTFHVLRAACRVMKPRGQGAIVVVGSATALDTPAAYGHYAASKAGVHALCQSAAKEAGPWGLRINVVAPGLTNTGMGLRAPEAVRRTRQARAAEPVEIADIAVFLASERAANVNGEVLLANGGLFTR